MKSVFRVLLSALIVTPLLASSVQAQFSWNDTYGKSSAEFSVAEWRAIIDNHWAAKYTTEEQLDLFDTWFTEIDTRYGVFHNSALDINELRDLYRPEIAAGVSRGRFSAIMNHFTYRLQELHTYLFEIPVRNTPMVKGVPQMIIGQWGQNRRFGALLTPLPDSTLLVYESFSSNKISLVPGDKVLGYDGVLWKDIYPRLLEAELPLFLNSINASTPEADYYYAMQAAGLNWHLFDTIDIVKYATGDTLHFETDVFASETRILWGKEQIAPPGTTWPSRTRNERVGWDVIDDTRIGLITVTSWSFDARYDIRNKFQMAVAEMMNNSLVDGLIFDFRFNTGGGALAKEGLELLFNETVPTVGFDRRVPNSDDYLEMEPDPQRFENNLVIRGDPQTFFDHPIAILIGPGSISAGELEATRLSFHPNSRIFGLPAPGGNSGSDFVTLLGSDWFASRSHSVQYLVEGHEYLSHKGLQPDERVWFTQEDVSEGVDTVIKSAIAWIRTISTDTESFDLEQLTLKVDVYPNPAQDRVSFRLSDLQSGDLHFTIHDTLGRLVQKRSYTVSQGSNKTITWDIKSSLPRSKGLYIWTLANNDFRVSDSFVIVK